MKGLLYFVGEFSIGAICFHFIESIAMTVLKGFIMIFTDFSFDYLLALSISIFLLISIIYRLWIYINSYFN